MWRELSGEEVQSNNEALKREESKALNREERTAEGGGKRQKIKGKKCKTMRRKLSVDGS